MSASPVDLTKTISEVRGLQAAHNNMLKRVQCVETGSSNYTLRSYSDDWSMFVTISQILIEWGESLVHQCHIPNILMGQTNRMLPKTSGS